MSVEKKIKILEISGGLSTEGIGIFLLNTFENIDKDRFQLDFALATKYEEFSKRELNSKAGKFIERLRLEKALKEK